MAHQQTVHGVPGGLTARRRPGTACHDHQVWTSVPRPIDGYGPGATLTVSIRHDDDCHNGHDSFAVTGEVRTARRRVEACGCLHDEIAQVFPELAHLIRWHLCSTDGPMPYLANALYFAGDRDFNGLRKGETRQLHNGSTGEPAWCLKAEIEPGKWVPLHELNGIKYANGERPTVEYRVAYRARETVGEGKAREFDKARAAAVWPEATDEELSAPREELKAALEARLPALIAAMRADVEAIGFEFEAPVTE